MNFITRKQWRKIFVVFLCAVAVITQSFCVIKVDAKEQNDSGFITNTYSYAVSSTENSTNQIGYVYNDLYFDHSSYNIDHHLAVMSAILAQTSGGIKNGQDYTGHSANIKTLLNDIGFQNIEVNADYSTKPSEDSFGVAAGMKQISTEDGNYTVLALSGRCSNYENEWLSNFDVGTEGDAKGFSNAADKMLTFAKAYVTAHSIKGKVKVWITGYSRSAAAADIAGSRLDDDPMYLGTKVDAENIYDYTFATPNSTTISEEKAASYKNIYNYFFDNDLITMIPFASWGFRKYGQNITLTPQSGTSKQNMLAFLSKSGNDEFYQNFTKAETEDAVTKQVTLNSDPDAFKLLQDNEDLIQYNYFYFNEGDTLPPFANNLKEFVEQKLQYILNKLSLDRTTFVNTYEQPIAKTIFFFNSISDDQLTSISDYFKADDGTSGIPGPGRSGLYIVLTSLKTYHESVIRGTVTDTETQDRQSEVIDYIINPILERSSADDATKAYFRSDTFTKTLIDLLSNLINGYDTESFDTKANRRATRAFYTDLCVTILGNSSKFFANHQPETMIARMQSEDNYYTADGYKLPFKVAAYAGLDTKGKITEDESVGIVDGNIKELAEPDSNMTFTASAREGFVFEKWVEQKSDGSFIETGNNPILNVDHINNAHHYIAVFKKKKSQNSYGKVIITTTGSSYNGPVLAKAHYKIYKLDSDPLQYYVAPLDSFSSASFTTNADEATTLETDSNGNANAIGLTEGKYAAIEVAPAPEGYEVNSTPLVFEITKEQAETNESEPYKIKQFDLKTTKGNNSSIDKHPSPYTGDHTNVFLDWILLLCSFVLIICCALLLERKNNSDRK